VSVSPIGYDVGGFSDGVGSPQAQRHVAAARVEAPRGTPGAWRDPTIANRASEAIRRYGSYNPNTDVQLSTGVARTTDASTSSDMSRRYSDYNRDVSSYDSRRVTTSPATYSRLVDEAAALRRTSNAYNSDARRLNGWNY